MLLPNRKPHQSRSVILSEAKDLLLLLLLLLPLPLPNPNKQKTKKLSPHFSPKNRMSSPQNHNSNKTNPI
jgi:hypothetical protein